MNSIRFSIEKPVTIIVGIIFVVLFGVISLLTMTYQLSPTITEPEITVTTTWVGATPYNIEREIIEEQEKVLKGIPGLVEMESESFDGMGSITLKFTIETRIDDALLRVSNKLNEVPEYPENVDKPIINPTGSAASPVIWIILHATEDNPRSIYSYRTYFEDEVRQYLDRVKGVADLAIHGGTDKEMHIIINPQKMAAYGVTITELVSLLKAENVNISSGIMGIERRDYRIRTIGEFNSAKEIENIIIKSDGQQRIVLSDLAKVSFGYEKLSNVMLHNGEEAIAIGVKPESGVNVLELTNTIYEVVDWLNKEKLAEEKVYLKWVYDQRPYINGAIRLVKNNILIGGFLAIAVLLLFLRNVSSTVIIATSIPISIFGTFLFLKAFGRNLNVISLAGISFAVGMLVDNAIVVLENIDRHRKSGKTAFLAAYEGTKEVWGAILASTLTTIAVFLPIVFVQEEAGQLFRDIAIAVTCAVGLSFFVSVFVIPMFSEQLFRRLKVKTKSFAGPGVLLKAGAFFQKIIMALVAFAIKEGKTRIATILILTAFSFIATILLLPKMEYLPQGNRNLVMSILVPPPGLSYKERMDIGRHIANQLGPYMQKDHNGFPGISDVFYIGADTRMVFGAKCMHEERAGELVPLFMQTIQSIPGMYGVSMQAGIFETGIGEGRTIEVDISGSDIHQIVQVSGTMFGMIKKELPDAQIRPIPSLEILFPELKIVPSRDRLMAAGMNTYELGIALDILMDGRKIGYYKQEGQKKIDLIVKASDETIHTPEILYNSLISLPNRSVVPVYSLSQLQRTTGITQIRHLERDRTITLQVTPPETIPLQEAMEIIDGTVLQTLKEQDMLQGVTIRLSGAADKLTTTRKALQWNFALAVVITYLLMSALFGNFIYPLIIMFTIPLAAAGGFIGLRLVNICIALQPFDILTMLGFVILIGVVVNNAILIVYQALNNVRFQGMNHHDAVIESTRTRLRPIFMSAFTSIFGMLPLVIAPGPGSELYRGLGSVMLGGLAFSTIFTIFIIPAILMFAIRMEKTENTQS